jgi:hypothetical protein
MSAGIIGAHVLLYSDNPEADRAFFRAAWRRMVVPLQAYLWS